MAFQQGLSGLNTASKALDVTSNNIANASTVGFKTSSSHFGDVYANSLTGGSGGQIGIGTSLNAVQQQYTQGNVTTTNNPLDIAINGGGFFRTVSNGNITYTRNGQFHLDKNGFVVNDQGFNLTGYPANASGVIVPSAPTALQISAADIPPVATGASIGGNFTGVRANLNLDSRSQVPTNPWAVAISPGPNGVQVVDPTTYNFSTALQVYDTLGNPHDMTLYFRKTATSGEWQVFTNIDGTDQGNVTIGGLPQPVTLNFDTSGKLTTAMPLNVSVNLGVGTASGVAQDLAAAGVNRPNSAAPTLNFPLSFEGTTQFGTGFASNRLEQDGYASGHLTGLSVGNDGIVQGRYSNGQSRNLGQVVLANFTNPNGLSSLGNNQWAETSTSGPALVGAPNTGTLGALQAAAVEESNVDLTAELVTMITHQRNYQANAQSIKTQDQIMQTLVNLR